MSQNSEPPTDDAHRTASEGYGDITDDDAYVPDDAEPGGTTRGGPTRGSSGIFMDELADALRSGGVKVEEHDGWKRRGRRGAGLRSGPHAIILHHTASGRATDGRGDADYLAERHKHAPISNLYLDRSGTWWVLAAGWSNTNGKGGPWGPVTTNLANPTVIGIEAANNGTGEPWSTVMQDSYVAGVAALADRYNIETQHVLSHHEWAPDRKIDPAGPSRFGAINRYKTWDMNVFREAVNKKRREPDLVRQVAAPNASVDTYVIQPGDAWWPIAEKTMGDPSANWLRLAEANGGADRVLLAGAVLTIPGGGENRRTTATAPDFPGEAKLGTRGDVVRQWQEALIEHGVIVASAGNRDGNFGAGLQRAILELQQSWGWTNADGIAGPGTWRQLHAAT